MQQSISEILAAEQKYLEGYPRPDDGYDRQQIRSAVQYITKTLPAWHRHQPIEALAERVDPRIREALADWIPKRGSVLACGPTGAGKTTGLCWRACTLGAYCIEHHKRAPDLQLVKAADLARARRQHALGEGDPEIVKEAKSYGVLMLDDLGQGTETDSTLFEILDARYDKGLPSLVTSGFPPAELIARYGDAFVRRILESGTRGVLVDLFGKGAA